MVQNNLTADDNEDNRQKTITLMLNPDAATQADNTMTRARQQAVAAPQLNTSQAASPQQSASSRTLGINGPQHYLCQHSGSSAELSWKKHCLKRWHHYVTETTCFVGDKAVQKLVIAQLLKGTHSLRKDIQELWVADNEKLGQHELSEQLFD